LKVITYKNGREWAEVVIKTTVEPSKLHTVADRNKIQSDGKDLSFITVQISDTNGFLVPQQNNLIEFSIEGPDEIVATDNGNSMDMVAFPSQSREAFNPDSAIEKISTL